MKFLIILAAVLLAVNAEYPSATAFRSALDVAPWVTNYIENAYLGAKVTGVFVTTLEVENTTRYIEFNDYVFPTDLCVHVMLGAEVQDQYLPKSAGGFKIFYEVSIPVHINIPDSSDDYDPNAPWACPEIAVQCPDGSFAGLAGPDCKPNCPIEQPKGNMTYWEVANVAENYLNAYGAQEPIGIQLSILAFEDLSQQMPLNANETMEDNCIVVYFFSSSPNHVIPTPIVYQGVRMFYKQQPNSPKMCAQVLRVCADGSPAVIGPDCIQTCSPSFATHRSRSGVAGTVLIIVVISLLSCCICCCRACRRRCNKKNGFQRLRPAMAVLPNMQADEAGYYYPADLAAQQQEFSEHQMPPMMMMPAPAPYPMMPHPGMMMPPPPFPVMMDQDGNPVMPPHPFFHPMFGPMIATPAGFMMVPPPQEAQEPSQQ